MVAITVLPLDKPCIVIGVGRWLCGSVVARVLLPNFLLGPFLVRIDKPSTKSFAWICIQWYFMVLLHFYHCNWCW
jgi:hypothetical protein